jgi:dTDP-4-amino-4,6-dideoxygalactose transaminase
MTDVVAAIGIPQLERLGDTLAVRARNATRLTALLEGVDHVVCPTR